MSDESSGSAFTEGYVVPIARLLAFVFVLIAGLTAQRALSGDPADVVVAVGFVAVAVLAPGPNDGRGGAGRERDRRRERGVMRRFRRPAGRTEPPRTRGRIAHGRRDQNP